MNQLRSKQRGFAMAAFFLAVLIGGVGSLNIKTSDGETVASAMGIDFGKQTEFSAFETDGPVD